MVSKITRITVVYRLDAGVEQSTVTLVQGLPIFPAPYLANAFLDSYSKIGLFSSVTMLTSTSKNSKPIRFSSFLSKTVGSCSNGENPRGGAAIKGLLRRHKRRKDSRKKALYLDKGIGTLADGYRLDDVIRISNYFLEQGTDTALRSRLDFLLGHAMLCRSEDKLNTSFQPLSPRVG
jgi:hypothetical protein